MVLEGRTSAAGSREASVKGTFSLLYFSLLDSCCSLRLPCSRPGMPLALSTWQSLTAPGSQSLNTHLLPRAHSAFLMQLSALFPAPTPFWKVLILGLNIVVYLSASRLHRDLVISVSLQLAQCLIITGYGMKREFPLPPVIKGHSRKLDAEDMLSSPI